MDVALEALQASNRDIGLNLVSGITGMDRGAPDQLLVDLAPRSTRKLLRVVRHRKIQLRNYA